MRERVQDPSIAGMRWKVAEIENCYHHLTNEFSDRKQSYKKLALQTLDELEKTAKKLREELNGR